MLLPFAHDTIPTIFKMTPNRLSDVIHYIRLRITDDKFLYFSTIDETEIERRKISKRQVEIQKEMER